jgi:hypothetical protein
MSSSLSASAAAASITSVTGVPWAKSRTTVQASVASSHPGKVFAGLRLSARGVPSARRGLRALQLAEHPFVGRHAAQTVRGRV